MNGAGTFVSDAVPPVVDWRPRANAFINFTPTTNTTTSLGSMVYGDVSGATASGTLGGLAVSVDPAAAVPAYGLGAIPVGGTIPVQISARMDRPINNGAYGWAATDLVAVRTCLPDPSINSWVSGDGLTPVTGTGDYAGDVITLTDSNGATVGTSTVGADLTWTFTPTDSLPAGVTMLTATETDEFGLTGESAAGTLRVVSPSITVSKFTNGVDVLAAPGPHVVAGSAVTWTYDITNTGDTYLDVTAIDGGSDDSPITVICPDGAAVLAPAETVGCTATGIAVSGPYANTVTVTGAPRTESGETISATFPVTARDSSWYTGVAAAPSVPQNPGAITPEAASPAAPSSDVEALARTGTEFESALPTSGLVLVMAGLALVLLRRRQVRS